MAYKINDNCIACGACSAECPLGCIDLDESGEKYQVLKPEDCIECGACAGVCPVEAPNPEE